jgi:hypothetical protein
MELHKMLFLIFILLQALDVWSTVRIVVSGKGREANKIMAWCILQFGIIWGLTIPKLLVIALIWFVLDSVPIWGLWILCILYVGVLVNNLIVLRKF